MHEWMIWMDSGLWEEAVVESGRTWLLSDGGSPALQTVSFESPAAQMIISDSLRFSSFDWFLYLVVKYSFVRCFWTVWLNLEAFKWFLLMSDFYLQNFSACVFEKFVYLFIFEFLFLPCKNSNNTPNLVQSIQCYLFRIRMQKWSKRGFFPFESIFVLLGWSW